MYCQFVTLASFQESAQLFVLCVQSAVMEELMLSSGYDFSDAMRIGTNPGRVVKNLWVFQRPPKPIYEAHKP